MDNMDDGLMDTIDRHYKWVNGYHKLLNGWILLMD